ncbi:MAG: DUF116 domain-containing protein [Planctomycetota bacterium]|jgi:hypothetical protein
MSDDADRLNKLLSLIGSSSKEGSSLPEFCTAITFRKNKEYALLFSRTKYTERIVFLPQCLRAIGQCEAEERAAEYVCQRCGGCKIAEIIDRAESLGYMDVKILKGGSAVGRLLDELKPKGLLGVACSFEGSIGMLECERKGVAVQFIALLRDGCADTDVDLDEVFETMEFQQP